MLLAGALGGAIACSSVPDGPCGEATLAICERACACGGEACALSTTGGKITFPSQAGCRDYVATRLCDEAVAVTVDWASCEAAVETAWCAEDGSEAVPLRLPTSCGWQAFAPQPAP